jgi:protein-S-isoprenylcysteine O-methyltransferase Ste14
MTMFLYYYLPMLCVLAVFAVRMKEVATKRATVAGKTQEKLTFNLFMLCGVLIVVLGLLEFNYFPGLIFSLPMFLLLWWPIFLLGAAMSVAAFALRWAAIRNLGKFWSLHVEMREGHEFVTSGPFAYARHPVYFSMILELLGIGLMLNAWVSLIVVFLIFIPTMMARVKMEEIALVDKFGEPYRAYMREVPAIVPRLSPRQEAGK